MKIKEYNKLINKEKSLQDKLAKTQRAKDLEVDTINKEYEFKIDKLMRDIEKTQMEIQIYKKFVEKN